MGSRTTGRTNVLMMLTDQERADISDFGALDVATPGMDRLGEEGMRFERAYTPISICTSARASLLTGLYPHNHGMLNNCHGADAIRENLPEEHPTFGEILDRNGYTNTYVGKWHVGRDQRPDDFGFRYLGGGDGAYDIADPEFYDYQRQQGIDPDDIELQETIYTDHAEDPTLVAAETPIPIEATRPYYMAERTIEALERHAETGEPFVHRTDFIGPHHPYVVPEPYATMYEPDDIEPWPSFAETFDGKPRVHENYTAYRGVEDFDWETWAAAAAKYFGFATLIDHQRERILDALDRYGLTDDTAVICAADHGNFIGHHRQFNKGPLMYEGTYRIPLAVRWPDVVEPATSSEAFVRLLDLMPTILDIGGVTPSEDIDGRSLRPILTGQTPTAWPESVFAEYHGDEFGLYSQRMVRTDKYKFVYNTADTDELYDHETDPHELHNRIDHPAYADRRRALEAELEAWMTATDDPIATWTAKTLGDQ